MCVFILADAALPLENVPSSLEDISLPLTYMTLAQTFVII